MALRPFHVAFPVDDLAAEYVKVERTRRAGVEHRRHTAGRTQWIGLQAKGRVGVDVYVQIDQPRHHQQAAGVDRVLRRHLQIGRAHV